MVDVNDLPAVGLSQGIKANVNASPSPLYSDPSVLSRNFAPASEVTVSYRHPPADMKG